LGPTGSFTDERMAVIRANRKRGGRGRAMLADVTRRQSEIKRERLIVFEPRRG